MSFLPMPMTTLPTCSIHPGESYVSRFDINPDILNRLNMIRPRTEYCQLCVETMETNVQNWQLNPGNYINLTHCIYHNKSYVEKHLIERPILEYLLNYRPNENYCLDCIDIARVTVYPEQNSRNILESNDVACFKHLEMATLYNDKVYCYKCILEINNLPPEAMDIKPKSVFQNVKIGKEL